MPVCLQNVYKAGSLVRGHFGEYSRELLGSDYKTPWREALSELGGLGYFTAPASSKFHLSKPGGLFWHSVNVADIAIELRRKWAPGIPRVAVLAAALLHDVGKCGWPGQPRYAENPEPYPTKEKWQKYWGAFVYKDIKPNFSVRDLSVVMVTRWGFPAEVIQAVMVHDGAWAEANKDYGAGRQGALASLLSVADFFSATVMEEKYALRAQYWSDDIFSLDNPR